MCFHIPFPLKELRDVQGVGMRRQGWGALSPQFSLCKETTRIPEPPLRPDLDCQTEVAMISGPR